MWYVLRFIWGLIFGRLFGFVGLLFWLIFKGRSKPIVLVWILVALCLLAYVGGIGKRARAQTRTLPVSTVSRFWCNGQGGVTSVTEHSWNPGVYTIKCADGISMTGVGK